MHKKNCRQNFFEVIFFEAGKLCGLVVRLLLTDANRSGAGKNGDKSGGQMKREQYS